ncbi:hypothetical protein NA57DRAFT_60581 [Rhizodiscina lignyota]|uniref:Uncharacterized protein n=1 Tax=Rhizodiscina lignyota TaxID=1504668 RepID=A0A9P4I3S7_9PEZI|nr:hypothetical protein NA57DRAFT_60581 [Rhizodiscina lignyota]
MQNNQNDIDIDMSGQNAPPIFEQQKRQHERQESDICSDAIAHRERESVRRCGVWVWRKLTIGSTRGRPLQAASSPRLGRTTSPGTFAECSVWWRDGRARERWGARASNMADVRCSGLRVGGVVKKLTPEVQHSTTQQQPAQQRTDDTRGALQKTCSSAAASACASQAQHAGTGRDIEMSMTGHERLRRAQERRRYASMVLSCPTSDGGPRDASRPPQTPAVPPSNPSAASLVPTLSLQAIHWLSAIAGRRGGRFSGRQWNPQNLKQEGCTNATTRRTAESDLDLIRLVPLST